MAASDRTYPSVWTRPARKERSTLSREQIVAEALRLLDSEGMEALSMRKLAAGLGVGATSLYWHVANRDELIELVINEVYGEIELPDAGETDDWQAATRRFAHSSRSTIRRHPWMVSVLDHLAAGYPGPNQARVSEHMLRLLEAAGFPLPETERVLSTLGTYVTGVALAEAAWQKWLARHGQTEQEWAEDAMRVMKGVVDDDQRWLEAAVAAYEGKDPQQAMDDDFDYGLDRILDGLQVRLDAI
jgi:AcrR family transcriptional regulator